MVLGSIIGGAAGGATVSIIIRAIDDYSSTFTAAQKSMMKVGTAMTLIGGAGAAGLAKLTGVAIDFETAFTGVRKTVDLTEQEFTKLNQNFKDLSTEIPLSFIELAKIGELAGQLGISGVADITKFTKVIADIASTTNLTAEQAATDFARFANIMGMPISNVDRLGATIVDLGNNLATTESEIVAMSMRIAGAGNALDMTEGQVLAWASAMSSVGIEAQMGGTAISKFMINMSSAVSTGSDDLEKFAAVAGMTTESFSKAFEDDASKALQIFFNGLGKVKEEGGDVLAVLADMNIKEVRLRDTILRLSSSSDTLNTALGIGVTAWDENTALVDEANKRYATAQAKIDMFKNKLTLLASEMGSVFLPVLVKVIDILGMFLGFLEKHPTLTKFAAIVLALGTAFLLIVGPLLILAGLWPTIIAFIGVATGVIWGAVTASLAFVAANIWWIAIAALVVALIVGLIVMIKKLWNAWDTMSTKMKIVIAIFFPMIAAGILLMKHWDEIKAALGSLGKFFMSIFTFQMQVIKTAWDFIVGVITASVEKIANVWEALRGALVKLGSAFKSVFTGIANIVLSAWNFIIDTIENSINRIINMVNSVINGLNKIKGVDIRTISDVNLGRFRAEKFSPGNTTDNTRSITINIDSVQGTDADDLAEALQRELTNTIRLN